jgi:dihydrofolate reductase
MNLEPTVTLIAAVSEDGFISRGKGVPWHLPSDKAHFRNYTAGKCLLLGRATYEEMLGWFTTQHTVYVLTHGTAELPGPGISVRSVQEAVRLVKRAAIPELVVCGGGQCYFEAIPFAQQLVLTVVQDRLYTGVPFPPWSEQEWQSSLALEQPADADHSHSMIFRVLERRRAVPCSTTLPAPEETKWRMQPMLQPPTVSLPSVAQAAPATKGYFQR